METAFNVSKEQAKQLLLKGCYRMALKKYAQLTGNLPEGLQRRTVAVLHLNQGICLQFMEKLDEALQCIGRSLEVDPLYDKAYFRKIQVLSSMGKYEEALACVPQSIMNAEFAALLEQIRKTFAENLVSRQWKAMLPKLSDATTSDLLVEEVHQHLYQLHREDESAAFINQLNCGTFYHYARFLSENSNYFERLGGRLMDTVYKLLVVRKQTTITKEYQPFWTMLLAAFGKVKPTVGQIYSMVKLAGLLPIVGTPGADYFLEQVSSNIRQLLFNKSHVECLAICFSHNLQLAEAGLELSEQQQVISNTISVAAARILQELISSERWENVQAVYSIYHSLQCLLRCSEKPCRPIEAEQVFVSLLRLKSNVNTEAHLSKSLTVKLSFDTMGGLLRTIAQATLSLPNLMVLSDIVEAASQLKQFKEAPFYSEAKSRLVNSLSQEGHSLLMYALLGSLLCKISYPEPQSKHISLKRLIQTPKSQIAALKTIELLVLLCFTAGEVLEECLSKSDSLIQYLTMLLVQLKQEQTSMIATKLRMKMIQLFGCLLIDNEEETEKRYSDSMGVDMEKIRAARILQGELKKDLLEKISKLREGFLKGCDRILPAFEFLATSSSSNLPQANLTLKSVLSRVAKHHPQRLLNSCFIDLILSNTGNDKFAVEQSYAFFSRVCKKMNPQQLLYRHQLPICNLLLQAVEKASHELTIFESLLALVNLSSLPLENVDIKPICRLLMEENEYILHAVAECLNNFVLKGQFYFEQVNVKDHEIIEAMLRHYRQQLKMSSDLPQTDYSHPHKLYLTLIGLQMVFQDYKQVNVKELTDFGYLCEQIGLLNATERMQLLIKGVHYHSHRGSLNKQLVLKTFSSELETLRRSSPDKYASLAKILCL